MFDFVTYMGIFLISSFFTKIYSKYYAKEKFFVRKFIVGFLAVVPILFLSIYRYEVGNDYRNYIKMFNLYINEGSKVFFYYFPNSSLGTIALAEIGKVIFGSAEGVLAVYSILTFLLLFFSILYYKDRIDIFIGIFLMYVLFFPASMNTIRQMLAVSIILFSLRFLEKGNTIKYIVGVGIAFLVHNTSIICLVFAFYMTDKNRLSKLIRKLMTILSWLFPFMIVFLFSYGRSLPGIGFLFENYELSFNTEFIVDLVIRLLVYGIIFQKRKHYLKTDKFSGFYFSLAYLDLIFIISSFVFPWCYRLSYYTCIAQIFFVSKTCRNSRTIRNKYIRNCLFIVFYSFTFFMLFVLWERDGIVPYDTIFNHGISLWR